jgi:4-carboxymuconolactone decarboxylase
MGRLRAFGLKAGLTQAQIDELDRYENSPEYTHRERLVLQYTEELVKQQNTSELLLTELKEHLSARELVELNLTIGFYVMINLFIKSLRIL